MKLSPKFRTTLATLLASTCMIASPSFAQEAQADADNNDDEIVVTAQKREQNLQDVPISIQALGETKLENAQVESFDDVQKLLPSVSSQSFGPGQAQIYFRGVTSGGDGLHVGPLPTSGLYVDEIPLTTIAGSVDFHVYDMARVEALAGPQGTLYGASSLSGTLRMITNKPSTAGFAGSIDVEGNKFGKGDFGGSVEGMLNFLLSDRAALRVVGYYRKDGGYIDNIAATRTFTLDDFNPVTNLTINNNALVKDNYNDAETYGGRAALKVDLDDNWTVTPQFIYQNQASNGGFLFDPRKGDLKVSDFLPSRNEDNWWQAALTIEGKLSDWDVVYSGGYFKRNVENSSDYSYYSVAYDTYGYYATYFPTGTGSFLDPTQTSHLGDDYTKFSQELRLSSPSDKPFRMTTGLFMQRNTDTIRANYDVKGIGAIPTPIWFAPFPASTGDPDTVFLSRIKRIDRDYAAFGQAEWDILPTVTLTAGIRGFISHNTIFGWSGLNAGVPFSGVGSSLGACIAAFPATPDRPCNNINKKNVESGVTYKGNISWKPSDDVMLYATVSTGFRPGGNNRRPGVLPFKSDTLHNYELGWKTQFGPLTFNGAAFYQKWKDLQFGLVPLGQNGVTNTYNAGDARIYGLEGDVSARFGGLTISAAGTYIDAKLTTDFCEVDPVTKNIVCVPGNPPAAAAGTRLPVQPNFKGLVTARYEFPMGANKAFMQVSANHQGGTRSFLTDADFSAIGPTSAFTTVDASIGAEFGSWNLTAYIQNIFDNRGELTRNTFCATSFCAPYYRVYPVKPQIFGIKAGTEF
jgi:iron complex outermembrane recepter protein